MSQQMLTCIRNLINDKCTLKFENSGREPTLTMNKGTHDKTMKDGTIFLKIMISRITIDSSSTMTYIRSTLSDLDKDMIRFDSNLTQFNNRIEAQLDALQTRGESSNNIIVNLFKCY